MAWAERMNVGATRVDDATRKRGFRYVAFGFPGLSDIIGQTIAGRFVAVECKKPGGWPKPETFARWQREGVGQDKRKRRLLAQLSFLQTVESNGGIAFVCCDVCELDKHLLSKLNAAENAAISPQHGRRASLRTGIS